MDVSYSIVRGTIYGRKVEFKSPKEIIDRRGSWIRRFDINCCKDAPGNVSFGFHGGRWIREGTSFEKNTYSLKYPFLYCTMEENVYYYSSWSHLHEGDDLKIEIDLKCIFKPEKPQKK